MKIAWIRIKGFQQFEDTFIDFRHPETGKALDKICLIGRNGTGKSTILQILDEYIRYRIHFMLGKSPCNLAIKIEEGEQENIYFYMPINGPTYALTAFKPEIELLNPHWFSTMVEYTFDGRGKKFPYVPDELMIFISGAKNLIFENNPDNSLIYCPPESHYNSLIDITDVPPASLNEALKLQEVPSNYHIVSNETVSKYWSLLIYLSKKRDNDREKFEKHPENINKTKKQLLAEFDENNPDILKIIAGLWDEILGKAGLRFDYENAKSPIQLTDNLLAYVIVKNGQRVNYNKLSTGIRNFIFRFGHIKTLYYNKKIYRGFLLVDEPENSLFPDFLLDIISRYEDVTTDKNGKRNTQMFFATHSPIIASQFKPEERIILEWDDNGSVSARKGEAPEGDDPNDILYQDFGMTEIVSKKGQDVWKAYLELKKKLSREIDDGEKKKIAEEILEIGQKYKFVR